MHTHKTTTRLQDLRLMHTEEVHEYYYVDFRPHQLQRCRGCITFACNSGSTSTIPCTATLSPGCSDSTSTLSCTATTRRPDCTGSTAPMSCIRTRRLAARLLIGRSHWLSQCVRSLRLTTRLLAVRIAPALLRLCRASGRGISRLDFSSVGRTSLAFSRRDYSPSGLHRLYYAYTVHPDAPSRSSTSHRSVALALTVHPLRLAARLLAVRIAPALLRLCRASGRAVSMLNFSSIGRIGSRGVPGHSVVRHDYPSRGRNGYTSARHAACRRLLRLCRAAGCLGTSRGSSRSSLSTTSTTPRVRVPRHVERLVTQLVAPLVVDYFAYAVRSGASACCAARRTACHRLLHLRRTSACLGTSHSSSRRLSSTTSPTPRVRVPLHVARLVMWLVVDYFDYAARPSASARRVAHHAACRQLLRLRRAPGCLGTSHGSSRSSLSTTSTTPRVRVHCHVA
jgi:hypothetical protein